MLFGFVKIKQQNTSYKIMYYFSFFILLTIILHSVCFILVLPISRTWNLPMKERIICIKNVERFLRISKIPTEGVFEPLVVCQLCAHRGYTNTYTHIMEFSPHRWSKLKKKKAVSIIKTIILPDVTPS